MRAGIILAVAALLVATRASAQTAEVTVRGDPAGNFVSTADERDSPRELTDAASLVEPLPGVHVRRYGADDSFTTLSIRGSSSTEVAIVFAGVPLVGGADPTLDLATLPLWPGAVARVHRSFAPAALGPGSLGGTLVLDPPRATSPESTEVWAAGGRFGEARLRVGEVRALGEGGGRIATALSASRADDDFTYLDPTQSTPGHDVYMPR
jgi:iron complex outermembrane receptor protein